MPVALTAMWSWYKRTYEDEGLTATSRQEAMQGCAKTFVIAHRLARWDKYMRENEPPDG